MRSGLAVLTLLAFGATAGLPSLALAYNATSTLAGPAGKSHHHRMHMKKKSHSKMMMKKGSGGGSENKQTPTGGQPDGGAGKS